MNAIHNRIRLAFSVAGLSVLAHVATAQDAASVQKGARVRVVALRGDGHRQRVLEVGELQRLAGDTAVMVVSDRRTVRRVVIDSSRALEVSNTKRTHSGAGALIGLGIGGLAGLLSPCDDSGSGFSLLSCKGVRLGAALVLGAAGALVGALVGHEIVTDVWQPVRLRVGATPGLRSQVVVKLTIRR